MQPIPTRLFTPLSFGEGLGVRLFGEGLGVRLQLPYHSLHLLTKSDGISLRDIDYTVEGIGDNEERELRRVAKLPDFVNAPPKLKLVF